MLAGFGCEAVFELRVDESDNNMAFDGGSDVDSPKIARDSVDSLHRVHARIRRPAAPRRPRPARQRPSINISSAQDADRAAVREALARPDVRDVASELGLDLTRATAAIDTLEGPVLQRAGEAARQVNQQLVGGASTITITTTTLIIILLVIILLIVAVK